MSPIRHQASLPRICIIGAGAIGGFFGVRLAQGHADVSVVARGRTLEALQRQGWILESNGQRSIAPVRAVADSGELGPQDVVIVTVKAYAVDQIVALIKPLLGPHTLVVPALNGVPWWFTLGDTRLPLRGRLHSVDPQGNIEAHVPIEAVLGSVVYPACSSPEPGVARHHSGTRVVFGEVTTPAGAPVSARLQGFVALLKAAGFEAEASTDIRTEVWKKLLGNACFNPVSMLTGSATDLLIDEPGIYELFTTMMNETLSVGRGLGIDAAIEPAARIAITRKLGNVKTSMLQDTESSRPVEIDAILGAVIEMASKLGIDVPVSKTVYALARMRAQTFGLLRG